MSDFDIIGVEQLCRKLKRVSDTTVKAAYKGLQRVGLDMVADAQANLRHNGSVVTGLLRQSGRVEASKTRLEVMAGFFDTRNTHGYAEYVEYGRRAGKFPPVAMIEQWLRKKHSGKFNAIKSAAVLVGKTEEQLRKSAAFLIARKIAQQGTEPHPFFKPAYDKHKGRVAGVVKDTVNAWWRATV